MKSQFLSGYGLALFSVTPAFMMLGGLNGYLVAITSGIVGLYMVIKY